MNNTLNIFLKSLESTYKERDIVLISRWTHVRNEHFPAYTTYTLEVTELFEGRPSQRFIVSTSENMSNTYMRKEDMEELIKDKMVQQMITNLLKYYMYGELVQ